MSSNTSTRPTPSPSTHPGSSMPYSCVLCYQRKVKCDRHDPCSACVKARASCIFRAPPAPRRRKKALPESILLSRLRRYEEILRSHGISFDGSDDGGQESPKSFSSGLTPNMLVHTEMPVRTKHNMDEARESGELVTAEGKSKYFTGTLWMSLSDELRNTKEFFDNQYSSDEEQPDTPGHGASPLPAIDEHLFILSSSSSSHSLHALHPQPAHIFKLWQIFLDNVDPLVKIFHTSTVQQEILDGAGDLCNVSKPTEALLFAIYTCSVTSMTDNDCQSQLCEAKSTLLARYRFATKQALINVGFMRSLDLAVVGAFVLYLISIRRVCNHQILWIYSGILLRIAQRIGLHRDGSRIGLSVFETEIRRRLWWQIISLDIFFSELSGVGTSLLRHPWDTRIPLNVNDSDLTPDMKHPPIEHTGPTEMLFRLIQCQVGNFLREHQATLSPGGGWRDIGGRDMSAVDKNKHVDDLQALLEHKYLRFCDPSIPLHMAASLVGRCVIAVVRLPIYRVKGNGRDSTQAETLDDNMRDLLFATSVKVLEYDNLIRTTESTKRYLWHADISFQWHAVICMLSELRIRTMGPDIDAAWHQVEMLFTHRPQLLTKHKNALYVAIGNLALKAWAAREKALVENMPAGTMNDEETVGNRRPEFIRVLIAQRACSAHKRTAAATANVNVNPNASGEENHIAASQSSLLATATPQDLSFGNTLGTTNNAPVMPTIMAIGQQDTHLLSHQRHDLFNPAPPSTFRTHNNDNNHSSSRPREGENETDNMGNNNNDNTFLDPSVLINQGNSNAQNWLYDSPDDWAHWDTLVQEFDMGVGDMEVG
ncbi:hypothetical protein EMCG_09326 [[Emmonsia] crescens]|uniref:C6 finger domain transcription factor nscR n=1 Tax=[Emmonsia] crescens TaxID=73230 RepID=A0A0G2I3J2_9EURO|nr:hypothetical protein EMCG_09326 [Emmonsia crescens UAMH 3008]